jgi:CspA family cold shock protein
MPTGKLKMWNAARGFGFIQNDAGGPDMYLHASALKEANIDPHAIKIGDPLTYDVSSTSDGKTKASNVQRV